MEAVELKHLNELFNILGIKFQEHIEKEGNGIHLFNYPNKKSNKRVVYALRFKEGEDLMVGYTNKVLEVELPEELMSKIRKSESIGNGLWFSEKMSSEGLGSWGEGDIPIPRNFHASSGEEAIKQMIKLHPEYKDKKFNVEYMKKGNYNGYMVTVEED